MIITVIEPIRSSNTDKDGKADFKNVWWYLHIVKKEMGHKGFEEAINVIPGPSSSNEKSMPE